MATHTKITSMLVFLALGCSGESLSPKVDQPQKHPIVDRGFVLQKGYDPVEGTRPSVRFRETSMGFYAGCNTHSYEYEIKNDRLLLFMGGSTLLGCDPDLNAQDRFFADFFKGEPGIQVEGDWLTVTGQSATLSFLDKEIVDPDRPLTGHTWRINALLTGEVASWFVEISASVSFDENETVKVHSGCNQGQGTYQASDSELTFGPMAYTEMACQPQEVMDAEAHIQKVFSGVATYRISAAQLIVERADGMGVSAVAD